MNFRKAAFALLSGLAFSNIASADRRGLCTLSYVIIWRIRYNRLSTYYSTTPRSKLTEYSATSLDCLVNLLSYFRCLGGIISAAEKQNKHLNLHCQSNHGWAKIIRNLIWLVSEDEMKRKEIRLYLSKDFRVIVMCNLRVKLIGVHDNNQRVYRLYNGTSTFCGITGLRKKGQRRALEPVNKD